MPKAGKRLYLIDGYSNIFRAFYAIRELSNSKGEPTNAVWGFLQMLRKLLREEEPELVGVALDVSSDTVRKERFAEYKAQRKPMPEDLRPQIPWVRKLLEAHRIPILELEKYEADDVLGTLARKAAAAGLEVVLVSADKDLMQLVDERVSLFHTGREKLYGPEEVEEDFGVPPAQVTEVLALMGDASDNVPGVPGIGKKGAQNLIREYGSVEALLERANEVQRKSYREGLEQHREEALLSKELVTIHTDLPVEFEPEALRHDPPDPDRLRELYRELEFFSLLDELEASGGVAADEALPLAGEVGSAAEVRSLLADGDSPLHLAAVGEPVLGLAIGVTEGAVRFVDFRREGLRAASVEALGPRLAGSGELVGHDLKEVLRLAPAGEAAAAPLFDTMLVSYVLRPALRGHGLEEVALDRLGHKAIGAREAGWDKGQEPASGFEPLLAYAGERVELARRLEGPMRSELGDGDLARVYREIEAPLVPVLVAMEEAGVLLDAAFLAEMSARLADELDGLEGSIFEIAGRSFNLNSPQQLGAVLFDELGYPVIKKTRKTRSYSTSAETLQELAARGYPVAEHLLRYRELSKLKSTYVDALPALVAEDARLHTRFHQAVAATGRLSSANPNLQNIPIRGESGQQIRRAFRAPQGRLLLVADYNQIELRVLAHIAGEAAMIEAFAAGEDIHRTTAAAMFGGAPELVTPDQRRAAKVINFGIIYGISPFGLANNLGIGQSEAKRFIDAYLERYPGVRRYMEETLTAAEEEGKVATLYGRVRWLPELKSRNRAVRENGKRMAINARIQGTAADLLKRAMIAVHRRLRSEQPEARLLLTVHDELVLESPTDQVEAVGGIVSDEMAGVESLAVPLVVDVGSGETWYDAKVG